MPIHAGARLLALLLLSIGERATVRDLRSGLFRLLNLLNFTGISILIQQVGVKVGCVAVLDNSIDGRLLARILVASPGADTAGILLHLMNLFEGHKRWIHVIGLDKTELRSTLVLQGRTDRFVLGDGQSRGDVVSTTADIDEATHFRERQISTSFRLELI